ISAHMITFEVFGRLIDRLTICYLGYYQLGINGKELARHFGISRPSVSKAIKRGEKFAKEDDVKLLS
ncbi:MAG: hypothetical protein LWW97_12015, partial [Deltaproteobacteria bacterium]|nr:hypothetical protein [Deltaproteobacteria bacterium]